MKLGLKLWSENDNYLKPAYDLWQKGVYDYIELYVCPSATKEQAFDWRKLGVPIVLHAPHSYSGFNMSIKGELDNKISMLKDVDLYNDILNPKYIIFHPGINGCVAETIKQIKIFQKDFNDLFSKALIENKPALGLNGEGCLGSTIDEIYKVKCETGLGFCLDFGHASCSAATNKISQKEFILNFLNLNPDMFHLSDGDIGGQQDQHLHYGAGDFDLGWMVNIVGENMVSVETTKDSLSNLDDFKIDVEYLKNVH